MSARSARDVTGLDVTGLDVTGPRRSLSQETLSRLGRERGALKLGVLGARLVWVIPVITAIQAVIYGGLVASQQAGTFPIIPLAGFRIRIEEILILAGFATWLVSVVVVLSDPHARRSQGRVRLTPLRLLGLLALIGVSQGVVRGLIAHNEQVLLEVRLLIIPFLYFVLAWVWIKGMPLTWLANALYKSLSLLTVMLILGLFLPLGQLQNWLLGIMGSVYGGFSTAVQPLVVFFYALLLARILLEKKVTVFQVLLLLFIMGGLFFKVGKTNWAHLAEVPVITLLAIQKTPRLPQLRSIAIKRWLIIGLIAVIIGIVVLSLLVLVRADTLNDWIARSTDRITRPDLRGDITGGRLDMIIAGWHKFLQAPLFGSGLGYWYEYWYRGHFFYFAADHFSPIWIVTRTGLLAFIPITVLVLWYILKGFQVCRQPLATPIRVFVVACFSYTITLLTYSLYGVPQNLFEPQIFFWLGVAVVLTAVHHPENRVLLQRGAQHDQKRNAG